MREQFALQMSAAVDELYARNVHACVPKAITVRIAYPTNFAEPSASGTEDAIGKIEFRPHKAVAFNAAAAT